MAQRGRALSVAPAYLDFPRDPRFAQKAGPILDLYQGLWEGQPLGPGDFVLSAVEKTSIQARRRIHASLPPASGRPALLETALLAFQYRYEKSAAPFRWTFTRADLVTLMQRLKANTLPVAA